MQQFDVEIELKKVLGLEIFSELSIDLELSKTDKSHNKRVLSVFDSEKLVNRSEIYDGWKKIKSDSLHTKLNRLIQKEIFFDVSLTDFEITDGKQILAASDKDFLNLNAQNILCELQQSLLMKHLFLDLPFLLDDFAFEIRERESLMTEIGRTTYEWHCKAVMDVTRNWFERLLSNELRFL